MNNWVNSPEAEWADEAKGMSNESLMECAAYLKFLPVWRKICGEELRRRGVNTFAVNALLADLAYTGASYDEQTAIA